MTRKRDLRTTPDEALLRDLIALVGQSRRNEADIVAHIGEVDARRLYARQACPSMHAYCVEVLRLTDYEAYMRIAAARAARKYPMLLAMLRDGRLHVSVIARLASHLTRENWRSVLKRAANRTKREVEELIAELEPKPDVPARIRKVPVRQPKTPGLQLVPEPVAASKTKKGKVLAESTSPSRRPRIEPLAPERYEVRFTASAGLRAKLARLQALMRTSVPDGDLAALIEAAVTERIERLEARQLGRTRALGRPWPTPTPAPRPATFLPPSAAPSTQETEAAAPTRTPGAGAAGPGSASSSTTSTPMERAATTRRRTSASCAAPTTSSRPSSTTASSR